MTTFASVSSNGKMKDGLTFRRVEDKSALVSVYVPVGYLIVFIHGTAASYCGVIRFVEFIFVCLPGERCWWLVNCFLQTRFFGLKLQGPLLQLRRFGSKKTTPRDRHWNSVTPRLLAHNTIGTR